MMFRMFKCLLVGGIKGFKGEKMIYIPPIKKITIFFAAFPNRVEEKHKKGRRDFFPVDLITIFAMTFYLNFYF